MRISNWTLRRNYLLTEHENRRWLQVNSLFSCTSLDAWMITSTAARIELLVCKATARSFICAHCVQSADLQVCCPTSFTSLPNDLSPEGPAAVGVAHEIKFMLINKNFFLWKVRRPLRPWAEKSFTLLWLSCSLCKPSSLAILFSID